MALYWVLTQSFLMFALFCIISVRNEDTWSGVGDNYDEISKTERQGQDLDIFKNSVFVNTKGEVRPVYITACDRNLSDPPLQVIPQKRILGGRKSNRAEVPYQVALVEDGIVSCGGSVFNRFTVLTAAHCLYDANGELYPDELISKIKIVAGDHDFKVTEGTEQERNISNYTVHPLYIGRKVFYDVAVVQVDKPFEYNKFVQPLPIGSPPVKPEGMARISGWGYTTRRTIDGILDDQFFPNILKLTKIKLHSKDICAQNYTHNELALQMAYHELLLCAGVSDGSQDACTGDSGGPLACFDPNQNNATRLCGIIATGFGCGLPGFPGFYTRVGHKTLHRWIRSIAGVSDIKVS